MRAAKLTPIKLVGGDLNVAIPCGEAARFLVGLAPDLPSDSVEPLAIVLAVDRSAATAAPCDASTTLLAARDAKHPLCPRHLA